MEELTGGGVAGGGVAGRRVPVEEPALNESWSDRLVGGHSYGGENEPWSHESPGRAAVQRPPSYARTRRSTIMPQS